jgi:hypothetical protein
MCTSLQQQMKSFAVSTNCYCEQVIAVDMDILNKEQLAVKGQALYDS